MRRRSPKGLIETQYYIFDLSKMRVRFKPIDGTGPVSVDYDLSICDTRGWRYRLFLDQWISFQFKKDIEDAIFEIQMLSNDDD